MTFKNIRIPDGPEQRLNPVQNTGGFEVERREKDSAIHISGYAVLWDDETVIYDTFREKFQRGAFKRTIQNGSDVTSFFNHNPDYVIGRLSSGTLKELREDARGLYYKVEVPDTSWGKDLVTSIQRGDIYGNSFTFDVPKGGDTWDNSQAAALPLRIVTEARLHEVGPVTMPAYQNTEVAARMRAQYQDEPEKKRTKSTNPKASVTFWDDWQLRQTHEHLNNLKNRKK